MKEFQMKQNSTAVKTNLGWLFLVNYATDANTGILLFFLASLPKRTDVISQDLVISRSREI